MNWLVLIASIVNLLSWLIDKVEKNEAEQEALAALLRSKADVITKATLARSKASAANAAVPKSSSLPNDGFRRD